ncbi:AAA family ATPase [Alteromonas ponticola]|uniref:AAA family ATPase n=1 Tax=Alteromonas ponticola TaxID=2720613 RepID=A0ABX1R190_9ALTE|nr:AAA family ATPase [Alteromonas ponticola]NMH59226.1 AAA family ATPase [Alteromonas ponticola]
MMILVGGEKGGSGKSCLAQNIAVYLRTEKNANVLMVDCDPQRTTSDWIQERKADDALPDINCIQLYGKIRNELISLNRHYDYVVIDCGGQDNLALRSSMSVADHVLIPLRPKRRDLKTVPHMEDIISTCRMVNPKMNAAFVITQCPSLPSLASRILEAKEVCRSFEVAVLNSVTFSRNMYDDSEESGRSVIESEPNGKAAIEIRSIFDEMLARAKDNQYESMQPAKVSAVS